jgi:penicillin-binding protein 1A
VSKFERQNAVYRFFWRVDTELSSRGYEVYDFLRRCGHAYSSFLFRFRISGLKRVAVDLVDDALTFGALAAFLLLADALPPFDGAGDIWNSRRQYAIVFTDANGEIIGRRGIRQDDAIPLEQIPKHVIDAVTATEDARFFEHFGVDVQGTLRAVIQNARANGVVQGGSSLTQQVAKNLFLSPERTIRRKIHEAFLALWIEQRLSKDEILKLYLDRSYLGGGNHGVEAAAQYYFGKSIRDVTLAEAAMLAGLFKAPSKYAPHINPDAARQRSNVVLYRMLETGRITQAELMEARLKPPRIIDQKIIESPDWFLDWAYKDTLQLVGEQNLQGDYVLEVKTTIDLQLQDQSQRIVNAMLAGEALDYEASQAASITMAPDGAVRAIIGGRDYDESQFNRATDAARQPGSAFKPFVYLTALLGGYTPSTIVEDSPVSIGDWSPKNYTGKYAGRITLTSALARSYNSVPVKLSARFGLKRVIEVTHQAGVREELERVRSLPLGSSALSLLDLTTGYATFAAGGKRARSYTVTQIRRPNGDLIYDRARNAPAQVQAFPEEKIAELNAMLNAVVTSGTGQRAFLGFTPQAGKTGTNQGYRDAWFVGYTANNVTGVWFGNDDFTGMKKVTGGLLPAMTWRRLMIAAENGRPPLGLAGLPLTDAYQGYAAAHMDELQVALAQDDPPALRTASKDGIGDSEADLQPPARREANPDDVTQVLRDMFSLFAPGRRNFADEDVNYIPAKKIVKPRKTASLELSPSLRKKRAQQPVSNVRIIRPPKRRPAAGN